jgi:hypothetical protein
VKIDSQIIFQIDNDINDKFFIFLGTFFFLPGLEPVGSVCPLSARLKTIRRSIEEEIKMAILDELLGNGDSQNASMNESKDSSSFDFGPALGLSTGKILDFGTSESDDGGNGDSSSTHLTGIDGLALGVEAPFHTDSSSWDKSSEYSDSDSDGGGLLGGLL